MSPSASAAAAYHAAQLENAPPLKLVRLLYEGALRFLSEAEAAHAAEQRARFQERCLRAAAVVAELRLALDPAHAPELAANLDALYLHAEGEIRAAMVAESSAELRSARAVLSTLLDGWRSLEAGESRT